MSNITTLAREIRELKDEISEKKKALEEKRNEFFQATTAANVERAKEGKRTVFVPRHWFEDAGELHEYVANKWPDSTVEGIKFNEKEAIVELMPRPEYIEYEVGGVKKRANSGEPTVHWKLLATLNPDLHAAILTTETTTVEVLDEEALEKALDEHPEWVHDLEAALLPKKPTLVLS